MLNGNNASRIGLLASHPAQYQIRKLLKTSSKAAMRALGETDPARRQQIWDLLRTTELQLSEQFSQLATEIRRVDAALTRVSTLPLPGPCRLPTSGGPAPASTFARHSKIHAEALGARGAQRRPARPQGQGLHPDGRIVFDAAHLPLVLQIKPVASARP